MQKSCHQTPEQGDAVEPRISFVTTKVSWGMGCIITDKDIQCWKDIYIHMFFKCVYEKYKESDFSRLTRV